ncbi:hypothetical protein PVAP13_5KG211928, partial [Panicum virgatum]
LASAQKSREEHARAVAQRAADELAAVSRRDDHGHDAAPASPRGGAGAGILGSVRDRARSVVGAVRSTFSGGSDRRDESSATGAAAESAREYAADVKERAWRALAGDALARKGETDESAWQQGEDVRRRAAEKAREEARRAHGPPSEEEKGRAATANIYGKAAGAFREKMVMPTDVVERKRAEVAGAGEAATATAMTGPRRRARGGGRDAAGKGGGPDDGPTVGAGVQRRRPHGRGGHRHAAAAL